MAPEVIACDENPEATYDSRSDLWSLAVVRQHRTASGFRQSCRHAYEEAATAIHQDCIVLMHKPRCISSRLMEWWSSSWMSP
nr:misshapen-like kinase 1-like [Haemonchus contortus]